MTLRLTFPEENLVFSKQRENVYIMIYLLVFSDVSVSFPILNAVFPALGNGIRETEFC